MPRVHLVLIVLLAAFLPAGADADLAGREPERVEPAKGSPFPLPGPVYDDAGRIVAAPTPSAPRGRRDVLLQLPALPDAAVDAGSHPQRSAPRRRGEP